VYQWKGELHSCGLLRSSVWTSYQFSIDCTTYPDKSLYFWYV